MAQMLDTTYVEALTRRLGSIPEDTTPAWGTLDKPGLIEHLHWVVRHSMGREKTMPFIGNWMTKNLLGPLLIRGILPIPKNLQMPAKVLERGYTLRCPGDLAALRQTLDEYLALARDGSLECVPHPAFGKIGVDGWARFHVRHFEHHCKQFRV